MLLSSNKRKTAKAFGRSAAGYHLHARFQAAMAAQTAELAIPRIKPGARIADIGCGDGALAAAIMERAKPSVAVALDMSGAMLKAASGRLNPLSAALIQGDAEALPLASGSMDHIVSSLALQWVDDIHSAMGEMARALAPGGGMTVATLGPGTFPELASALAEHGAAPPCADFAPEEALAQALHLAGFTYDIVRRNVAHQYAGFFDFLRTLKGAGALGAPVFSGRGLARRRLLQSMGERYERLYRSGAGVTATYQVFFIRADLAG